MPCNIHSLKKGIVKDNAVTMCFKRVVQVIFFYGAYRYAKWKRESGVRKR